MSIQLGNLTDQEQGFNSTIESPYGSVKRYVGTARVKNVAVATQRSVPILVRSNKLGDPDVPLVIPSIGVGAGSPLGIIRCVWGIPLRITLPTGLTVNTAELLVGTSGEILTVATALQYAAAVSTANTIGGMSVTFGANTFIPSAEAGASKYNQVDPYASTAKPAGLAGNALNSALSLYCSTAADNSTPGTGFTIGSIPAGYGQDTTFVDIPVYVDVFVAPAQISVSSITEASLAIA